MYSYGPPHMAVQKQDDQHEHTFSNYVRIQDVVLKTCLRRWTIGKSGERGSGISVLPARHDDDWQIEISIYDINSDNWFITPNLKPTTMTEITYITNAFPNIALTFISFCDKSQVYYKRSW